MHLKSFWERNFLPLSFAIKPTKSGMFSEINKKFHLNMIRSYQNTAKVGIA